MSRSKKLPVEQLGPYLVPRVPFGTPAPPIVWRDLFGNDHPVEIEVGVGKGHFLATAGAAQPDTNFFGVEIVRKYQLLAASRVAKRKLTNVRVACADARALLKESVAPQSVEAVHVYFPDPWWKSRHRKRRVFTPEFAHTAGTVLRLGGRLLFATDVEAYFAIMKQIVRDVGPAFRELPPPPPSEGKHDLDYLTNFERKFRRQGRPIYRAAYERTEAALPATPAPDPGLEGAFTEFEPPESTNGNESVVDS